MKALKVAEDDDEDEEEEEEEEGGKEEILGVLLMVGFIWCCKGSMISLKLLWCGYVSLTLQQL